MNFVRMSNEGQPRCQGGERGFTVRRRRAGRVIRQLRGERAVAVRRRRNGAGRRMRRIFTIRIHLQNIFGDIPETQTIILADRGETIEMRRNIRIVAFRSGRWKNVVIEFGRERRRRRARNQRRIVAFRIHVRIERNSTDPGGVPVATAKYAGLLIVRIHREQGDEIVFASRGQIFPIGRPTDLKQRTLVVPFSRS